MSSPQHLAAPGEVAVEAPAVEVAEPGIEARREAGAGLVEESAAPMRRQVAERSATRRWRNRVQLRTSVTLGVFAVGMLVGVFGWRQLNPPQVPVNVYPALAQGGEPAAAALVATHLRANDAVKLGEELDQETLTLIRQQLSPLTTVDRMEFTGSTSLGDQTVVAYIVHGRDAQGDRGLVGLILILRDGTVVAK
ncbi:MAG: hypothetical protein FJ038_01065 [Chloroflexi bacterium]|nr:hypothetical protein [Chloroflexota bacterium]